MARTLKVCLLSVRPVTVLGEVQAAKAALSTRHWKDPGSFDLNAKLAELDAVAPFGPEVIDAAGGSVSSTSVTERPPLSRSRVMRSLPAGGEANELWVPHVLQTSALWKPMALPSDVSENGWLAFAAPVVVRKA